MTGSGGVKVDGHLSCRMMFGAVITRHQDPSLSPDQVPPAVAKIQGNAGAQGSFVGPFCRGLEAKVPRELSRPLPRAWRGKAGSGGFSP